jgi:hypothetical protein
LALEVWDVQSEVWNAGDVVLIDRNDTFGLDRNIRRDRASTNYLSTSGFLESVYLPVNVGAARVEVQLKSNLAVSEDPDRHHDTLVG